MATSYLQHFPKPLLDDLVNGRWLPIVGAGLSRNAIAPQGKHVLMWDELGRQLGEEILGYQNSGALDAISAYSHEYSRVRLVERLSELLLVDSAQPGNAHRSFCDIPFEIVCTTNFDFLLERQYSTLSKPCIPVLEEEQLSTAIARPNTMLLKIHGDVYHPQRLIATEEDYDKFASTYPLLCTYLANLLITRTAVLVGYSLDDPDFRQIWQVIGDRLGRLRRQAYAIRVDDDASSVARFQRRGVKVINLPGAKAKYGEILAKAFDELKEYLSANIIPASQVTQEAPSRELTLPRDAETRLVFFSIPYRSAAFYKEHIFPIVERHGLVPLVADDVIAPGDNLMAKIESLIERSLAVVVDLSTQFTLAEYKLAASKKAAGRVFVVLSENAAPAIKLDARITSASVPDTLVNSIDSLSAQFDTWFAALAEEAAPHLADEPSRLLNAGEYRAAVVAAATRLEHDLRRHLVANGFAEPRPLSLGAMARLAAANGLLTADVLRKIETWTRVRNAVVHTQDHVSPKDAKEIVHGIASFLETLRGATPR